MSTKNKNIVFGLSGSIACFKACQAISILAQKGFNIQTMVTESALKFIGKATLEGLSGNRVLCDMYEEGHQMQHIDIIHNMGVFVICPATASIINKLATGICDNLLVSSFVANNFKKPTVIFPAMNTEMLNYPATKKSLEVLSKWGTRIEHGDSGHLACGMYGLGRISEPEEISKIIEYEYTNNSRSN